MTGYYINTLRSTHCRRFEIGADEDEYVAYLHASTDLHVLKPEVTYALALTNQLDESKTVVTGAHFARPTLFVRPTLLS